MRKRDLESLQAIYQKYENILETDDKELFRGVLERTAKLIDKHVQTSKRYVKKTKDIHNTRNLIRYYENKPNKDFKDLEKIAELEQLLEKQKLANEYLGVISKKDML